VWLLLSVSTVGELGQYFFAPAMKTSKGVNHNPVHRITNGILYLKMGTDFKLVKVSYQISTKSVEGFMRYTGNSIYGFI
jgi:hypothetical protein